MNLKTAIFGMGVALVLAPAALGQSINADYNAAGAPVPPNTFGAAAGLAGTGHWNSLGGGTGAQALNDLGNNPTGASITASGANGLLSSTINLAGASPDQAALLQDILDLGGGGATDTFTISGLTNGVYDVYVYAMAPDSAAFITSVNVNSMGAQNVGGPFTGSFVQGITHSLHSGVNVTTGTITIQTATVTSFSSLAGFQLVLIPAPGALAMLGLAGLVGPRRRRD